MRDIPTTLRGRIGSELVVKHVKGDVRVATFQPATTKWRFTSDARTDNASCVEDGAHWCMVETWDTLASNVFRSCRKGGPVVIVIRPIPNGWVGGNGQTRSSIVYRASSVGRDLAHDTSQFTKNGTRTTDEPTGGTQGDPYSIRQGPGSTATAQAGGHQGSLGTDMHVHVAAPDQGTDILPDEAAPFQSEPASHVPIGVMGVELSVFPMLEEHERSEEQSSDPGRSSSSCFDYSALGGGRAGAVKNDALEPLNDDADEPPDTA